MRAGRRFAWNSRRFQSARGGLRALPPGTMVLRFTPRVRALVLLFAAAGGTACGSSAETSTSVTAPAGVRCQATVSNATTSFGPGGGSGSVAIGLPRECGWRATAQSSWITITSAAEGQGDATVTYRVAENGEPVARQAALVITDQQVTVAQSPAPCRYEVAPATNSIPAAGGTLPVALRTHAVCEWGAHSEVVYASVAPGQGRGEASVSVAVQPNTTRVDRPVSVVIAGHQVTAVQRAAAGPAPAPPSPPPPSPGPTPPPSPGPTPPAPPAPTPPPPTPPPPAPTPPPPAPTPPGPPTPPPTPPPPADPVPVREVKVSGRVDSVSGSCPTLTFEVDGRTVYTTAKTKYDDGGCRDIERRTKVKVEGMLMSDGRIRADEVEVDD